MKKVVLAITISMFGASMLGVSSDVTPVVYAQRKDDRKKDPPGPPVQRDKKPNNPPPKKDRKP